MQTPLGIDSNVSSGLLRNPYKNKLNPKDPTDSEDPDEVDACGDQMEYYQKHGFPEDSKELNSGTELDSSLETPEDGELLLDPDSTEWHTEVTSEGNPEENPYTYDLGDSEVSADDTGDDSKGDSNPKGEHEDSDAVSNSDVAGLTSKEKGMLFQSLSAPGSGVMSAAELVQAKIQSGIDSSGATPLENTPLEAKEVTPDATSTRVTADDKGMGEGGEEDKGGDKGEDSADAKARKSVVQRANTKAWTLLTRTTLKFTRGRALLDEEEGAITFSTDVNFLAFVAALGLAGLKMRPYKPSQVVRQGTDSVFQAILDTGAVLHFNVDRRGFLDKINLDI